jgi:hypothetical protein
MTTVCGSTGVKVGVNAGVSVEGIMEGVGMNAGVEVGTEERVGVKGIIPVVEGVGLSIGSKDLGQLESRSSTCGVGAAY